MDLTDIIDYFLPRLSRRKIRSIACDSWGLPSISRRTRIELRCLELILALYMPKPEKEYKRIDNERRALGYPVTYHGERILIFPGYGVREPRVYVLFNAMNNLLKR